VMFLCANFCAQTVMVHIVPHATDIGVSVAAAASVLSISGLLTIASKLALGSVIDRIGSKRVAIIVLVLISASFLWLLAANELWMLYLFAVAFGISWGGFTVMQSPIVAEYFGLKAHGAILGLAIFAANIGGATGSLVAGRIYDMSSSYYWAFILCAVLGIAGLILSILLKVARK
jgi:MFS family permease